MLKHATLAALASLAVAGPAAAHDGWRHRHRHRHWHPPPVYVVPPPAWHGWGGVYVPPRPPVFYGQRRPYDDGYGGFGVPRFYTGPDLYQCSACTRVSC